MFRQRKENLLFTGSSCNGVTHNFFSSLLFFRRRTHAAIGAALFGQTSSDCRGSYVDLCTAYDGVYHASLGPFPKLDCSATKRVPVPILNDTSSEGSGRDDSGTVFFGTDTILSVEISTMENRPRGVWYASSYTIAAVSGGGECYKA